MPDLFFVAFPRSSGGPLRTPVKTDQNLPHMSLVITHAKFLLDQVGHAWAGPQRSFEAQSLGTLEQQSVQALPVFLAQTGLAPGPSGFAQSGLALGTILFHPTGHGLTNHLDLAGNGRLILASLEQANGLEAPFLQGFEIASYSGRVSHA